VPRQVTAHELAASVDELVAGASAREPMESTDSKSGARFERVVIDGRRYVLKHVDLSRDWIMRQVGDVSCWPVVVWQRGVVDLAPDCIDHTIVGAAFEGRGGAVLMRDVSEWLVPAGDAPVAREQHLRFVAHLAAFHAACWGWDDDIGLLPLSNRYALFGPQAIECEEALGFPEPVPRIARDGWRRLAEVAPRMHAGLRDLRSAPWPLVEALAETPHTFLHGDWKMGNLGTLPDGRTALVDWSLPGAGPPVVELAHYLALNAARLPPGCTKDDTIAAYRAALEANGVATGTWWGRQLRLGLLGMMLQLGWEKSFDETGKELAWWAARVDEGIDELAR
jgi:hypothetical protein